MMLRRFFSVAYLYRLAGIRFAILCRLLPPGMWYRAAFQISRLEAFLVSLIRPNDPAWSHAWMLHFWVDAFRLRGPFPMPVRTFGMERVKSIRAEGKGLLLTSSHVPFFELFLTALERSGEIPDLVVSAPYNIIDGKYRIPLTFGTVPAAPPGTNTLLRIRSLLKSGGMVGCMVDVDPESPLSPAVLKLAGKLSAPVLRWSVKLNPDGVVDVSMEPGPHMICDTEESIDATMAALEAYRAPHRPKAFSNPPLTVEASGQTVGRHA